MKHRPVSTSSPFLKVVQREWRLVSTHSIYYAGMIVVPVFFAVFLLTLMGEGLPGDLPIAVVDLDNTSNTRKLVDNLDSFSESHVVLRTANFTEARELMQQNQAFGILVIPRGFTDKVSSGKQPTINYYLNYHSIIGGNLSYKNLRMISEMANGAVGLQMGTLMGKTETEIMTNVMPIVVKDQIKGNKWLNYSVYLSNILILGIIQLLIMQVTAYAVGVEIKAKSAEEWLETAGGSMHVALAGKLAVHTLIWFVVGCACLAMLYTFCGFPLANGWGPMLLALLLLIVAAEAVGVFFITLVPILRLGVSLASLFGVLTFSIVGFSFPIDAMYSPFVTLTYLFPMRYYYMIYTDQSLNGFPLSLSIPYYLGLAAFVLLPLLCSDNLKRELLEVSYVR